MNGTPLLDPTLLRPPSHVALNLFLAAIPVALAFIIARGMRREMHRLGRVRWLLWLPLLLLWLAFLPNTCYLLTEWRHFLDTVVTTPVYVGTYGVSGNHHSILTLLMVIAFYLLYTGAGLWMFFLALWPLDRLTRRRLGHATHWIQAVVFFFCAIGVYLGLVWRFNSTDVLHPHRLLGILQILTDMAHSPLLIILLFVFGGMLWLLYLLFDIWMEGALARVKRHSANL
jgi:uncharacterized membrane protein